MNTARWFLKTANFLVSAVVILFLVTAGAYSGYALWDNAQVYASVDDVQSELLKLKPEVTEEGGASFEELRALNPDVCAWLTLDKANNKMFGDLDLYEDRKFFEENTTGTLITPDRTYTLDIFACLKVPASEDMIFMPVQWQTDTSGLLDFVRSNASYIHQDAMDRIGTSEDYSQILAMTTCSSDYTDARTVLLAVMKPYSPET